MITFLPSIAAGNLLDLRMILKECEESHFKGIHVDVMDGNFVPSLTFGSPLLKEIRRETSLLLDVHIMVNNPDEVFMDYIVAGADVLTFHIEAARHPYKICQAIKEQGKRAGIALNPGTSEVELKPLLPTLDHITIMTVNPGFSRQTMIESTLYKIKVIRKMCEDFKVNPIIAVDGGVNIQNVAKLSALGANWAVVGGAMFNGKPFHENLQELEKASNM